MTAITWGIWQRFSASQLTNIIGGAYILEGTPVRVSRKPGWMPSWLARMFVNLDSDVILFKWPAPGGSLPERTQAIAFEAGSPWPHVASLRARGY